MFASAGATGALRVRAEKDSAVDTAAFDRLTRGIGRATDRRAALRGFAAGLAGLAVPGLAAAQDEGGPEIEACGIKGEGCFRNTDCCQGLKCNNGGDTTQQGTCVFKNSSGGRGDWCEKDKDCKRRLVCDKAAKKSNNACRKN
jgi:hypothetical protein